MDQNEIYISGPFIFSCFHCSAFSGELPWWCAIRRGTLKKSFYAGSLGFGGVNAKKKKKKN